MTTELNFYLSQYQCAADIWTWEAEIRFKPDLATKSLKGRYLQYFPNFPRVIL